MIGIAAMVDWLGLSESSRLVLLVQLDSLGTNVLTVQAGGVALGVAATNIYTRIRGWETINPRIAIAAGTGAALVIGAGARLSPTDGLRAAG